MHNPHPMRRPPFPPPVPTHPHSQDLHFKRQIGQGAYGRVYLCVWRQTLVAGKLLLGDTGNSRGNGAAVDQALSPSNPVLVSLEQVGCCCRQVAHPAWALLKIASGALIIATPTAAHHLLAQHAYSASRWGIGRKDAHTLWPCAGSQPDGRPPPPQRTR